MAELSGSKLQEEVDFIKRHLAAISAQKIVIPIDFTPPPDQRPRRVHPVEIQVGEPPKPKVSGETSSSASPITLHLKSIGVKPALSYTLSASPLSTISELKSQLLSQNPTAPSPSGQSWLLKGKALADSKLLREYDVKEGDSITLKVRNDPSASATVPTLAPAPIITPNANANAIADNIIMSDPNTSADATRPSLSTLDTSGSHSMTIDPPSTPGGHSRSASRDIPKLEITPTGPDPPSPTSASGGGRASPAGPTTVRGHRRAPSISDEFVTRTADSALWNEVWEVLVRRMDGDEVKAMRLWEAWFESSKHWLSVSQIAKVRDDLKMHGMGGL